MNEKTVIFITSSFGYGPTFTTSAIMSRLSKLWKGSIVCIANSKNRNLIYPRNIKIDVIDDRNEKDIERYLKQYDNPYVFSCMNRFVINPAKKNKFPIVFLDTLSWFWEKIPKIYLEADYYFYQYIPFIKEDKSMRDYNNAFRFSPILGEVGRPKGEGKGVLLSIGGGYNPLTKAIGREYLKLLAVLLNSLTEEESVSVAGGEDLMKYLKKITIHNVIRLETLDWQNSMQFMRQSNKLVLNGGLKTVFEALYFRKKVSFLFPSNQSQWALIKRIKKTSVAVDALEWENYFEIPNLELFTEKDTILFIENLSRALLRDQVRLRKVVSDFKNLIKHKVKPLSNYYPYSFKTDGATEIAKKLLSIWELS